MKESLFQTQNANTIAPGEFDYIQSSAILADTDSYGGFNAFDVKNFSTERIKIRLDGDTNRAFVCEKGEGLATDAEDKIFFNFLVIENKDSVNTISAGEIQVTLIRTAK